MLLTDPTPNAPLCKVILRKFSGVQTSQKYDDILRTWPSVLVNLKAKAAEASLLPVPDTIQMYVCHL